MQEAEENAVTLEDDDPAAVEAMLRFLYTCDYEVPTARRCHHATTSLVLHVFVNILADKYSLTALSTLSAEKFDKEAKTGWISHSFADAIEVAYTSSSERDRKIRDSIITIASAHAKELYTSANTGNFRQVAGKVPQFASELAQSLAVGAPKAVSRPLIQEQYRCPECATRFPMTGVGQLPSVAEYKCPICGTSRIGSCWWLDHRETGEYLTRPARGSGVQL